MRFFLNPFSVGGSPDADWFAFVGRWAAVSLVLIGVTCYFSYGFFHYDEHYQIAEFVSYKLGHTPAEELAWEFHARMRPWLQPGLYYLVARACLFAGVTNPFTLALAFRVVTGLCGWLAIVSLMLACRMLFADHALRAFAVRALALFWPLPYLAVRTSSEALSGHLLTLGLACLILGTVDDARGRAGRRVAVLLAVGLCFGLACAVRFQVAFAVVGVLAWVVVRGGPRQGLARALLLVVGMVFPLALGLLVDRWGYGEWTLTPWNYFHANIVQNRAGQFGTSPVWAYFYLVNGNLGAPLSVALTAALLVSWYRHPMHLLTWLTVPFLVVHSIIPHKEPRFLFPLALPATLFFPLAFAPPFTPLTETEARRGLGSLPGWLTWLWQRRAGLVGRVIFLFNGVALAAACLRGAPSILAIQKTINDRFGAGWPVYCVGDVDPYRHVGVGMFFYRPPGMVYLSLDPARPLPDFARAGRRFLVVTRQFSPPAGGALLGLGARRVYSTYPQWLERCNYFHWLDQATAFRLYVVERGPDSPAAYPSPEGGASAGRGSPGCPGGVVAGAKAGSVGRPSPSPK